MIHSPVAGLKKGRNPAVGVYQPGPWMAFWVGFVRPDRLGWHGARRLRVGGHGVLGRVRYQARVAAMASASGVPAAPNAAWYLLVSRTKGSPNW